MTAFGRSVLLTLAIVVLVWLMMIGHTGVSIGAGLVIVYLLGRRQ